MRARMVLWLGCTLATASGCSVATDFGRFVLADDAGAEGMDAGGGDVDGGGDMDAGSDVDGGGDVDGSVCVASAEICDGLDNDCNMAVDEGGAGCVLPNATATCESAACVVRTCNANYGDCTGGATDGCETDLRTTAHCGACATACSSGEICDTSGTAPHCATTCGGTLCGASCVDLGTDIANCGMCARMCSSSGGTATCSGGTCRIACDATHGNCDGMIGNGCERPLDTLLDCGGCGRACAFAHASARCTAASCAMAGCDAGWSDCDGSAATGCETTTTTYFIDADGDGWGSTLVTGCRMATWVARGGDCNDSVLTVNPGAREACGNGIDDNCNGTADDGCAPNDVCATATALPFGSTSRELGDFGSIAPGLDGSACPGTGPATERDAYFYVDVPEAGALVYLDTFGSAADTVLADEAGCPGPPAGCIDTACGISAGKIFLQLGPVAPGTGMRRRYFSVRLPAGHLVGAFWLNYEILPYPLGRGDLLAPGTGSYTAIGTTSSASAASAYLQCTGMPSGPEHIFFWTQCRSAARRIAIVNNACPVTWNQTLGVIGPYSDTMGGFLQCTSGTCPGYSPGIAADGPGLYVMMVDGNSGLPISGPYNFTITFSPPI